MLRGDVGMTVAGDVGGGGSVRHVGGGGGEHRLTKYAWVRSREQGWYPIHHTHEVAPCR